VEGVGSNKVKDMMILMTLDMVGKAEVNNTEVDNNTVTIRSLTEAVVLKEVVNSTIRVVLNKATIKAPNTLRAETIKAPAMVFHSRNTLT